MLINFKFENYKSYKDATTFTMVPGKYRKHSDHIIKKKNSNILKFSSIYGGNASGKSNIVDAIGLSKQIINTGKLSSFIENMHFKLDELYKNKLTAFEYEISIDDKIFAYGLTMNFDKGEILSEYLFETSGTKDTLLFDFDYIEKKYDYKAIKNKENRLKFKIFLDEFLKKNNKIFLTLIDGLTFDTQENLIDDIKKVCNWFNNTLLVITPEPINFDMIGLFKQKETGNKISPLELIKGFDTGITGVDNKEITLKEFTAEIKQSIPAELHNKIEDLIIRIKELKDEDGLNIVVSGEFYQITKSLGILDISKLIFKHCNNDNTEFGFSEESDGTKRIIELIGLVYITQFENKVFVVDEINRSLHPMLTIDFIQKFLQLSKSGGTDSQLIITSHEASLINLDLFRQDELWVTDRNSDGSSKLISLSKYNFRSDKVLDKDYLDSRYGGVPKLKPLLNVED